MPAAVIYTRDVTRTSLRSTRHGTLLRLGTGSAVLLLAGMPFLARGQGDDIGPLFADDAPLHITIEAPLRTLSRNRRDREELDGLIRYQDSVGSDVTLEVEIRTRGNSRMDICTFPPLRLDFRRGQVEGTVFAGQNRLKLVTLCKNLPAYRDYLALEYELYRVYNLLSDVSYRVRWLDVAYIDTDSRDSDTQMRAAFLVEDDAQLARRVGMQRWDAQTLDVNALDPASIALLSLFHFMIGNTDWSALTGPPAEACCHNGDVLRNSDGLAVLVPYDFDQAGLIDAQYAQPAGALPIRSVRQRLFRGYCAHNAALLDAIGRFDAARAQIESMLADVTVRPNTRRRVLRYIEEFYEVIDDPDEREESIISACRS